MRITGEQIRREQEESRRRSHFGCERQVRAPIPPPWDSFWREQNRRERGSWVALIVAAFAGIATVLFTERGFALVPAYYVLYTFVADRTQPICPRCGYRFRGGGWSHHSCRHCGLKRGQRDDAAALNASS